MELKLKILTLNCWGIPVISKDRKPRMLAIAKHFLKGSYDIICLQEVWTDSDYNLIRNEVKGVMPYSHYFYSGVTGSGICIISKYQFHEVFFHQWPVNGYVHKLHHGDWFGGKGVGVCRLKINGFNINIYSAHLHAEYDKKCDEYMAHRVLQAYDTAQFIRLTSANADLVVLAGDLNTEPGDLAYRILLEATKLIDSYTKLDQTTTAQYFSTNETRTNSYSTQSSDDKFKGVRIDYVMYRSSSGVEVTQYNYEHPLPRRVPGKKFSYSDHEAVTLTLAAKRVIADQDERDATVMGYISVLIDSISVCDDALKRLKYHKCLYWFCTMFLVFMLCVTVEMNAPYNYIKTYQILRVLFTISFCFTLIMATLWNSIEYNAVLSGKLTMEITLEYLLKIDKN